MLLYWQDTNWDFLTEKYLMCVRFERLLFFSIPETVGTERCRKVRSGCGAVTVRNGSAGQTGVEV